MPTSIDPQPADNELECGHCGRYFYYELTRCPHCGTNVYPSEDEEDTLADEPRPLSPARPGLSARLEDFLRRLFKRPYRADELFGAAINQADLFDRLLRKTGGDREAAERLVQFEQKRLPHGNRLLWIQNAIQRWEHDNRRH